MRGYKRRSSIVRRLAGWVWKSLFVLCAMTVLEVLSLRFLNPPFTMQMAWDLLRHQQPFPDYYWRPIEKISPHLRKAVLAGEDQRFLSHRGFDFAELNVAFKDMALNRRTRGASTITMQAARTVFLWPDKGWLRKMAEAYYTLLIEICWDKGRILEIYLNTVDWGDNVIGAEAASKKYFKKACTHLTRSQSALLAAILPNPKVWSPTKPGENVLKRQKRILKDMKKMPLI